MTQLYDIARWFEHRGLVGEKEIALVMTIVAISRKPLGFGLEAPAGSGKTVAMDLLLGDESGKIDSLINSDYVYFKDAGSDTSFYYDADKINSKQIVVFKELQKDAKYDTVEAIKSLTEGKSANRKVVDVTKKDVFAQEVKPKPVMYTLAIENNYKPDPELRRRCITMCTDISKTQTEAVLEKKANLRWDKKSNEIMTEEEAKKIKKNVNSIFNYDFTVVNPYAPAFAKVIATVAPDQKVRSMAEHFWDVMEGVTRLNSINRVALDADTKIANIQDLAMTLDIYKTAFLRDVYGVPPLGDVILKGIETAHTVNTQKEKTDLSIYTGDVQTKWFDVNHIRKSIKDTQNIVLSKNVVLTVCRQLVDAGYLEDRRDEQTVKFQLQEKYKEFATPNWKELISSAALLIKKRAPDKYDKWLAQQSLPYLHPLTGEEIELK